MKKHERYWLIIASVVSAVLVALTPIIMIAVHYSKVSDCNKLYNQMLAVMSNVRYGTSYLNKLKDKTTTDVLPDDVSVIEKYQKSLAKASEVVDEKYSDGCKFADSDSTIAQRKVSLQREVDYIYSIQSNLTSVNNDLVSALYRKDYSVLKQKLVDISNQAKAYQKSNLLTSELRQMATEVSAVSAAYYDQPTIPRSINKAELSAMRTSVANASRSLDKITQHYNNENNKLANIEAKVKAAPVYSKDGTYIESGLGVLHSVGVTEVWGIEKIGDKCRITKESMDALAVFCPNDPDHVYITTNQNITPTSFTTAYFNNAMRHELSHRMIYFRCGTTNPSVIGTETNFEATTNAYAALYMGGQADVLNSSIDDSYFITQAAYDAAAKIHNNQCN